MTKRRISPLKAGTTVQVVGMTPEEACEKEMFVEIDWEGDTLAVPSMQLEAIADVDEETQQAISVGIAGLIAAINCVDGCNMDRDRANS